ncbi:MAG: DUF4430 domain-containing protein [Patescibacteria group bacterium]
MSEEKKKVLVLLLASASVLLSIAYLYFQKPAAKSVAEKKEEKNQKPSRFRIDLTIINGKTLQNFQPKVDEGSTILDFMEDLRQKDELKYEITKYSYGNIIESINTVENNKQLGMSWKLYINNNLSEELIDKTKVDRDNKYKWIYEKDTQK